MSELVADCPGAKHITFHLTQANPIEGEVRGGAMEVLDRKRGVLLNGHADQCRSAL
jgi:hypothetical protein